MFLHRAVLRVRSRFGRCSVDYARRRQIGRLPAFRTTPTLGPMEVPVRRQRRRSPGHPGSLSRLWPAILVLWLAFALGAVAPASAQPEPLPACRYDDVPAAATDYADWQSTLVDTIFMVPASYAPPDLVPVSRAGLAGGDSARALLIDDLTRLAADAKGASASLAVESGYRSYENQVATFQHWVDVSGRDAALRVSARPGHSEHQLGTALDFKSAGGPAPWEVTDWATTPAGSWLAANAWHYGFVLSYPRESSDRVCYDYEPWHFRYYGMDLAAKIHDSGETPREYLWAVASGATSPSATSLALPSGAASQGGSAGPSSSVVASTPVASATPGAAGPAAGGLGPLLLPGLVVLGLGALVVGLVASSRRRRARRRPPAYRVRTRR
jgi:D-alanyl-D-alanine carboxypeptidase